jgi:acetylornithine aminotransferase
MELLDVYLLYPFTPVRASGAWLYDDSGTAYLDCYGGHAVISIGHSHPHYTQRVGEQLDQLGFYSNAVHNPLQVELAEKLGELSGYADYRLFLCNSGAEANENALKLAAFTNGRSRVLVFEGAFHGRTAAAVEATDNPALRTPLNHMDNWVRLPLNDIEALEAAFARQGSTFAAALVEGIQGVAGVVEPEAAFLQALERLCTQYGVELILDEVQSGYGRTGCFFAHQWAGIRPGLITIAKGMGNGFPVAGVLVRPDMPVWHGMLGTTFGGNHLACAASLAVLQVLEAEQLMANATQIGEGLAQELVHIPGVRAVRGRGLMLGVQLDRPAKPVIEQLLLEQHVFVGSAAQKDVLRILPPLNLKPNEAERLLQALHTVLSPLTVVC